MSSPSPSPSYGTQLARMCCYEDLGYISAGPTEVPIPNHRSPGPSPNDPEPGDMLLLTLHNDDLNATVTFVAPADFTLIQKGGSTAADAQVGAYYKIVDGTEGNTLILPDQSYLYHKGFLILIKNVDPANPINTSTSPYYTSTAYFTTVPGPTTTKDYALCVVVSSFDGADAGGAGNTDYISVTSPWIKLFSKGYPTNFPTNGVTATVGYKYQEAAGFAGDPILHSLSADGSSSFTFAVNSYWPQPGSPSEGTPSEGTPSDTPSEGTPSESTPSSTPSEGTPSDTPSEGTPSEGTPSPSEGTPSDSPSEGTPSEGTPSEATPSSGTNVTTIHCYTETELFGVGTYNIPIPNSTSLGNDPKNPETGDLILIFAGGSNYYSNSSKFNTSYPPGFTNIQNYSNTTYDVSSFISYKFIDAKGIGSTVPFTYNSGSSYGFVYAILISGSTPTSPPINKAVDYLSSGGMVSISGMLGFSYGDTALVLGVFEEASPPGTMIYDDTEWNLEVFGSFGTQSGSSVASCAVSFTSTGAITLPSTNIIKQSYGGAYVTTIQIFTELDADSPSEGTPSEGTPSFSPSEGTPSSSPSGSPSEGTPSSTPSEGTPSSTPSTSPTEGTPSSTPSRGTPSDTPSASPEFLPILLDTSDLDSYSAIDQLLLLGWVDDYSGPPFLTPIPGQGVKIEYSSGLFYVPMNTDSRYLELCVRMDVREASLEYELLCFQVWDRGRIPADKFSIYIYPDEVFVYTFDGSDSWRKWILDGFTEEERRDVWFWLSIDLNESETAATFTIRVGKTSNRDNAFRVLTFSDVPL